MLPQAQTLERQNLYEVINTLSDSAVERLVHYADFLRYEEHMEELEEIEDIAYIKAHKNDGPSVPLSEIIKDYESEHGPLR